MAGESPMSPMVVQYTATLTRSETEWSGDLSITTPQDPKRVVDMIRFTDPIRAGAALYELLTERPHVWAVETIRDRDEEDILDEYSIDQSSVDINTRSPPPEAVYVAACHAASNSNRYSVPQQLLQWISKPEEDFAMFDEFQWQCKVILEEVFIDAHDAVTDPEEMTVVNIPLALR